MPTAIGAETLGERVKRLRSELVRVRATIARAENNGAANNLGGTAITEIAYSRALSRERELEAEIARYEARLTGSAARSGVARIHVRLD